MANLTAVLRKTIDGLPNATPQLRAKVYEKARAAITRQIQSADPPLAAEVAEQRYRVLEDAIAESEAYYQSVEGTAAPVGAPVAPPPVAAPAPEPVPPEPAPAAPEPAPSYAAPEPERAPRAHRSRRFRAPHRPCGRETPRPSRRRAPRLPPTARRQPPSPARWSVPRPPSSAHRSPAPNARRRRCCRSARPPTKCRRWASWGRRRKRMNRPHASRRHRRRRCASGRAKDQTSDRPEPRSAARGGLRPASPVPAPSATPSPGAMLSGIPEADLGAPRYAPRRAASRSRSPLFTGVAVVALVGLGALGYLYLDDIRSVVLGTPQTASVPAGTAPGQTTDSGEASAPEAGTTPETAAPPSGTVTDVAPATPTTTPPAPGGRQFTQRLLPDGTEVDEGPGTSAPNAFEEGTNVAAATIAPSPARRRRRLRRPPYPSRARRPRPRHPLRRRRWRPVPCRSASARCSTRSGRPIARARSRPATSSGASTTSPRPRAGRPSR